MQKWEYLHLWASEERYSINGGKDAKYKANENKFALLNQLGKEGWELIGQEGVISWTFKRPIE